MARHARRATDSRPLRLPNTTPQDRKLATVEPATSRWISEATVRHTITLLVCAGLIGVGELFEA